MDQATKARTLDEQVKELTEQEERMQRIAPLMPEADQAHKEIVDTVVSELGNIQWWHFWRIIHYVLTLRVAKAYHLHFQQIMKRGAEATAELDWIFKKLPKEEPETETHGGGV